MPFWSHVAISLRNMPRAIFLVHSVQLHLYPQVLYPLREHEDPVSPSYPSACDIIQSSHFAIMIDFKLYITVVSIFFFSNYKRVWMFPSYTYYYLGFYFCEYLDHILCLFSMEFSLFFLINLWNILVNSRYVCLRGIMFCQYLFSISYLLIFFCWSLLNLS